MFERDIRRQTTANTIATLDAQRESNNKLQAKRKHQTLIKVNARSKKATQPKWWNQEPTIRFVKFFQRMVEGYLQKSALLEQCW